MIYRGQSQPVNCRQVQARLLAYRERALPAHERQAVQRHCDDCDHCAGLLRDLVELDAGLTLAAARQRPQLSRESSIRIQANVYQKMRRSLLFRRAFQWGERLLTLVMFILVVAMAMLTGQGVSQNRVAVDGPVAIPLAVATFSGDPLPSRPAAASMPVTAVLPPPTATIPYNPDRSAGELAAVIMAAALAGDQRQLQAFFSGIRGTDPSGTTRVWLRLRKCDSVSATDLTYQVWPQQTAGVVRVDVLYQDSGSLSAAPPNSAASTGNPPDALQPVETVPGPFPVAEIKMRHVDNNWQVFFAPYPALVQKCGR
jgi:hypothetical protein